LEVEVSQLREQMQRQATLIQERIDNENAALRARLEIQTALWQVSPSGMKFNRNRDLSQCVKIVFTLSNVKNYESEK
jgi:hypothetical protein